MAAAAIAGGVVPVVSPLVGVAELFTGTTATGIATAMASTATVVVVTSCFTSAASAVASSESGLDADSASSGFAALVFAWAGLACSGLTSVSAVACSTAAVSRSAEPLLLLLLLFAGLPAAELSRAPPALASVSSGRRAADELFEAAGADSPERLLSAAAALLLSTSEAKLSLAGGASDFAARWEL